MGYITKTENNRKKYLVERYGHGHKHKWTFNLDEATDYNKTVIENVAKAVKRDCGCKLTIELD